MTSNEKTVGVLENNWQDESLVWLAEMYHAFRFSEVASIVQGNKGATELNARSANEILGELRRRDALNRIQMLI